MVGKTEVKNEPMVLTGNMTAAHAVCLCKPDVIAMYPITPQTPVVEYLSQFKADELLDAEMVEVEGENSAMGVLIGASGAGGRVFSATSDAGLVFMYDGLLQAPSLRLPIVMVNVDREQFPGPPASDSLQDMMRVKDSGWVQIVAETNQEILDTIIMAYRLAEDPEILLPVMVCYSGIFLSHLMERVEVPYQEEVDRFLAPVSQLTRPKVEPGGAVSLGALACDEWLVEYRYKHAAALNRVKGKIEDIEKKFYAVFGRSYGGQIEEYRTEDAEVVLVTMGSCTGTARVVIDEKRNKGLKVGLIKIRVFRPFPRERLAQACKGKKAIGVIDRSICYGWNCGDIFLELRAALYGAGFSTPIADFITGLAGMDIPMQQLERALDITYQASLGESFQEVTWLPLE